LFPSTSLSSHGPSATAAMDPAAPVPPSPLACRWLANLESHDAWLSTSLQGPYADLLSELVTELHGIGVFPAERDVLVSWLFFDRDRPALASSRLLAAPDAGEGARRPALWISGYFQYDGQARIGSGEIRDVEGEACPVLETSRPLTAGEVFDLVARLAARAHEGLGRRVPGACKDGPALSRALTAHLSGRPERADVLANRFPLRLGFRGPRLSADKIAANRRAEGARLFADATAADYRVPVEVMSALVQPGADRMRTDQPNSPREIARRLRISPTALTLAFGADRRLTFHGRQCLNPGAVRPGPVEEMRALAAMQLGEAMKVRALFRGRHDLAVAVAERVVNCAAVGKTLWDPELDGG